MKPKAFITDESKEKMKTLILGLSSTQVVPVLEIINVLAKHRFSKAEGLKALNSCLELAALASEVEPTCH